MYKLIILSYKSFICYFIGKDSYLNFLIFFLSLFVSNDSRFYFIFRYLWWKLKYLYLLKINEGIYV